jgi:hypothetical protein
MLAGLMPLALVAAPRRRFQEKSSNNQTKRPELGDLAI